MERYGASNSTLICGVVLVLGLLLASTAHAATFTMFGASQRQMGDSVLRRVIPGSGTLTGPASQSGSLMVPAGRFGVTATSFQFFAAFPGFAQQISTFTEVQTAPQTLAVGGGPGGLEFCPPVGNPLNPTCNQAAGVAGYLGFTGFVDYDPGPNQFGGTFRIARKTQSVTSFRIATGPSQFAHQKEIRGALPAQAGGPTTFPATTAAGRADWNPGVPRSNTQYFQATPGVVTISPMLAPGEGWIQTQGPAGTATPFTPLPSTSTGFPFTTGMVRGVNVNSQGNLGAYTVTGANYRGPDGQGNIVLVAGGIFQTRINSSSATTAIMKIGLADTTLPEPTMGVALAAGVAALLTLLGSRQARRS